MTRNHFFRLIHVGLLIFGLTFTAFAQAETLTNGDVVLMSRAGLSKELIMKKVAESAGNFDTSVEALIDLKKSGISDEIISLMMEKTSSIKSKTGIVENPDNSNKNFGSSQNSSSHVFLKPNEALKSARTIALDKSSIHPSRQALEKELLKRKEWQDLNLNIVRYKDGADLFVEIGYVSLSWITHRYVWRVYDSKSGTVIAAGETTSWGSLAKNLAREIAKSLKNRL